MSKPKTPQEIHAMAPSEVPPAFFIDAMNDALHWGYDPRERSSDVSLESIWMCAKIRAEGISMAASHQVKIAKMNGMWIGPATKQFADAGWDVDADSQGISFSDNSDFFERAE